MFALNKVIPGYSDVKMPVLSNVQPFSFISQDGKQVTENDIRGKVCVVEYFFTTCKGICPKMNRNMKSIYEKFKKNLEPFQYLFATRRTYFPLCII